jgi:hypothetical protein
MLLKEITLLCFLSTRLTSLGTKAELSMKKKLTNLAKLVGVFLLIITSVEANCNLIRDMDTKNFCKAISTSQASKCYLIKDNDYKFLCLSLATSESSRCSLIKDSDKKNLCKGIVQ